MLKKVLVYTFNYPTLTSYKVLKSLENEQVNTFCIKEPQELEGKLIKDSYDYILGLGDYRRDGTKLRIEQRFVNKYGNKKIIDQGKDFYLSTWDITDSNNVDLSSKPGNGPCNRSGYHLALFIDKMNLKTKYAFIHVPKDLDANLVKNSLKKWITSL